MAAWLPECIESLEAQSLPDYEILAVDGGYLGLGSEGLGDTAEYAGSS